MFEAFACSQQTMSTMSLNCHSLAAFITFSLLFSTGSTSTDPTASTRQQEQEVVIPSVECLDSDCNNAAVTIWSPSRGNISLAIHRSTFSSGHLDAKNKNCLYETGNNRTRHDWAIIKLCSPGVVTGMLTLRGSLLGIVYDNESSQHLLALDTVQGGVCGTKPLTGPLAEGTRAKRALFQRPVPIIVVDLFVEMLFVVDFTSFQTFFASNITTTTQYVAELAFSMNRMFTVEEAGVNIVFKGIEIWTQSDRAIGADLIETSERFAAFSEVNYFSKHNYDVALLLHSQHYGQDVFGIANSYLPCDPRSTAVVVLSNFMNPNPLVIRAQEAVTISAVHQVAHVLGVQHDKFTRSGPDATGVVCNCTSSTSSTSSGMTSCIMDDVQTRSFAWSRCSMNALIDRRISGLNACVVQRPARNSPVVRAICGNSVVEQGELCDCPSSDIGCGRCCSDNCQFSTDQGRIECTEGTCCDFCRFTSRSFDNCRPVGANRDCDRGNVCSGRSAECEGTNLRPDGFNCTEGDQDGHCFKGLCLTRQAQCRAMAGRTAMDCSPELYDRNTDVAQGNCGQIGIAADGTRIVQPCLPQDVLCGQLKCRFDHLDETYKQMGNDGTLTIVSNEADGRTCNSVSYFGNSRGLAADGTKCGTNLICLANRCVSINASCPLDCNGNGQCVNSVCSCDPGFVGPTCTFPCAFNCSNTGRCLPNGTCDCFEGFVAPFCLAPGAVTPSPVPTRPTPLPGRTTPARTPSPDNGQATPSSGNTALRIISFTVLFIGAILYLISVYLYFNRKKAAAKVVAGEVATPPFVT